MRKINYTFMFTCFLCWRLCCTYLMHFCLTNQNSIKWFIFMVKKNPFGWQSSILIQFTISLHIHRLQSFCLPLKFDLWWSFDLILKFFAPSFSVCYCEIFPGRYIIRNIRWYTNNYFNRDHYISWIMWFSNVEYEIKYVSFHL